MGTRFSSSNTTEFPIQYDEIRWPVTVDVLEAGFICAFLILIVCFYLILPSFYGKNKWHVLIRVTISLLIGLLMLVGNFGQDWETGHVKTKTAYRAGTHHEIDASIGIHIGLRSINVTLKADTDPHGPLQDEQIDYNERFEWTWDQGRFGFGPFAGHLQQSFREAQRRGVPFPILWIIDYLVVDGEGLRFGRFYRTAGWYAHILEWTAFPCWLLANIMFLTVIRYGAALTIAVGLLQLAACLVWTVVRNPFEMSIPFEDGILVTKFGASFWITFAVGIICVIIGIIVIVLDLRYPDEITVFFGIDPLSEYDEQHLTAEEIENLQMKSPLLADEGSTYDDIQLHNMEEGHSAPSPPPQPVISILKRRTTIKRAQKSLFRGRIVVEDQVDYENLPGSNMSDHSEPPPRPGKKPTTNVQPVPPRKRGKNNAHA